MNSPIYPLSRYEGPKLQHKTLINSLTEIDNEYPNDNCIDSSDGAIPFIGGGGGRRGGGRRGGKGRNESDTCNVPCNQTQLIYFILRI